MKWRTVGMILAAVVLGWVIVDAADRTYARHKASRLILQLLQNDVDRKAEALKQLREMGPSAAPAATDMLRHEDARHRRAGLLACEQVIADCLDRFAIMNCAFGIVPERWGAERAFKVIGGALDVALSDGDADVRSGAARLILKIPESELENPQGTTHRALSVLHAVLQGGGDPEPRLAVIESLAGAKPTLDLEGISALIEATSDPEQRVSGAARHALVESLARHGGPRGQDARKALKAATPMILRTATAARERREELYIHFEALTQLGTLGESSAVPPLIQDLYDENREVRAGAAVALGRLGSLTSDNAEQFYDHRVAEEVRGAIPVLITCLEDQAPKVRRHAARALGMMGAAAVGAIPALRAAAEKEPDQNTRHWIIQDIECITRDVERNRPNRTAAPAEGGTPRL